jgi:hypothetical protein
MNKRVLALVVCLIALCGCAQHYVMKLSNGQRLDTASKPKLIGGSYHYKDAIGGDNVVPAGRVSEIAPASMTGDENKSFRGAPSKPRHWYRLWMD